jgi:HAD superfamily hydrolase (TIGR01549 family)
MNRAPATSIDVPANTPLGYLLVEERWIAIDVGETLIDETRVWSIWADALGIPRLTFMAALGATLATGGDFRDTFRRFGADDWGSRRDEVEAIFGGFQEVDLYPDARRSVDALCRGGYQVAIIANQPAQRNAELRALGFAPDVMAMSEELGVSKPDPAFFARALDLMGGSPADQVAYVGDRLDNDVLPSARAGMHAVWMRRGPWGVIGDPSHPEAATAASMVIDSLDELVQRIGEVWA